MSIKTLLLAGSLLSALAAPVFAQSPGDPDYDEILLWTPVDEGIIVTGTLIPTPIDQVGRSVTVVTEDEITRRQQRFLTDALSTVPGVQVRQSGSFGSLSQVSLRGLPVNQTLVVQDGIVINDPSSIGNAFNFGNFDTTDVARIEVLRGAQGTLYGSDAIGGVINIVTKDGRDGTGGEALFEGGSFGTVRAAATVYGGNERASGRLSFGSMTSDGFSVADEANGNTEDDGFDNLTVSGKGRIQLGPQLEVEGIARYGESRTEFDVFDFGAGATVDGDAVDETETLTLGAFATLTTLDGKLENRAGFTFLDTDRVNFGEDAFPLDAQGQRRTFELQSTYAPTELITLSVGGEFDEQDTLILGDFGNSQEIDTLSGYVLAQVEPLDGLSLNAGLRYDDADTFDDETTFTVSGVYALEDFGTRLRGSYAEGFRAPEASELSFNAELDAEFSEGWDIGIEQDVFGDRAVLSLTYFDQDIDDLIAFDLTTFTFANIERLESRGVEAAIDTRVSDRVSVNAAYTWTDATNVSTDVDALRQPEHRAAVDLGVQATDALSLSLGAVYNGEESDVGDAVLDDYFLVNLRGAYALNDTVEIFGRVDNLLDEDYQDVFGFGTTPLSGYGGVRARF